MDMQIDSDKVKSERTIRAWSQEHLAEVTGLGLRTIQRIESSGAASYESVRALAAVFEIRPQQLTSVNPVYIESLKATRQFPPLRALTATVLVAIALSSALFLSSTSWAEQIMLDIDLSYDNEENTEIIESQLLIKEGKDADGFRIRQQVL